MARQIINVGTSDKGDGDPIRTAFQKVNSNFGELYSLVGGTTDGSITTDIIGSVYADDSTLIVDGVTGTLHGRLIGDVEGSVFADDSTKIIDGILGKVVGPIQTSISNVSITGGTNGQVLTTNGSGVLSWAAASTNLGNFKIHSSVGGSTLGTVDNPDTGGWGGYDILIDSGGPGGSDAYVYIPSVPNQTAGTSLQIVNVGNAASLVQVFGRGGVQVVTNQGITEKVFEFADNGSLVFPDATVQTTAYTGGGATIVSAPLHQYGQAGDTAGWLAYDNEYFYWCFQNYVDNSTACWRRVGRSLTSW